MPKHNNFLSLTIEMEPSYVLHSVNVQIESRVEGPPFLRDLFTLYFELALRLPLMAIITLKDLLDKNTTIRSLKK